MLSDIIYSDHSPACLLDLYLPNSSDAKPLVAMFHGGGWVSGQKEMYHEEALWFCEQGFACATINYRLAPLDPYPAAIVDAQRAIQFLLNNQENHHYDTERIFSFGNSAGGHLSCMVGLLEKDLETGQPTKLVNAVVAASPITDLRNPEQKHFPIAHSFLDQFMASYYVEDKEKWEVASPVTHIHDGIPPILLFHGSDDDVVPVEQSQSFYAALNQAGCVSEYHEFPGEGHSYTLTTWEKIRSTTIEFLRLV